MTVRDITALEHAVSSVLIREDSRAQQLIYYMSHILNGPEMRYPLNEKLALVLI